MKRLILLGFAIPAFILFSCNGGPVSTKGGAAVTGSDSTAVESVEESAGCKAVKKLVTDYKMRVNMAKDCDALMSCQVNFTRELDEVYQQHEDLSVAEKASVQNDITSLGLLISKKKTELGCQ